VKADVTKNKLVLVVRADPMMDRCVGDFLTARGYTPVRTSTLEEALTAVAHNQFLFSVVDLDGTDGLEFLQHLKAEGGAAGSPGSHDPGVAVSDAPLLGLGARLELTPFPTRPRVLAMLRTP
jgi:CheY-like chemotaxis protein